ncbi:MAG: DUF4263 domain-containing protein [Verrucomicrobia bacterium]|nr:DUF4263 domain-containing protein [Verrucomicrobiota bacterium]
MQNENELQQFIAENPWLLNTDYESVPELPRCGLEYPAGDQRRIDLILRDRIHRTPVVVEFKAKPFLRENIGQVLEYKARVTMTFNKENDALFSLFQEFVLIPRLVLVVKSCDNFSRIACNLSGIHVYEYENLSRVLDDPDKVKYIRDVSRSLQGDPYPLSLDRHNQIKTRIYIPIKEVLRRNNMDPDEAWTEPKIYNGYFHEEYTNMFVNRWMLQDWPVSIGLLEDILGDGRIHIIFYSRKEDVIKDFTHRYESQFGNAITLDWIPKDSEGYARIRFDRPEFFEKAGEFFEQEFQHYLQILDQMGLRGANGGHP